MPKIGEMIESKYLKQSDVEDEREFTIRKIGKGNVAREDEPEDIKWMVAFEETKKPMVLNSTNIQLMAKACGSEDTDDWVGKKVTIYVDPNVSFGGKLVGGLRVKVSRPSKKPAGKFDDMEDDVPFN